MTTAKRPRPAALSVVPPLPPDLRRGLCVGHPDLRWWTSDVPRERDQAVRVCLTPCPALAECRSWSLSLRPVDDLISVLGGLTVGQRDRMRRARQHSLDAAAGP